MSNGRPPNILLVVCDQLTALTVGAYGDPVARTPNIDALAARGVRCAAAYTSYPTCVPARASLMTGRHASDLGCVDNAAPFGCDVPTMAHYLTNAGYDCVLSGKMHFVGPDQLHGFARRLTTDIYPSNFAWLPDRDQVGTFRHTDDPDAKPIAIDYVTAGVRQWSGGLDYDEETHFRALEYLRSRRTRPGGSEQLPPRPPPEDPFFLCVSYHHPHEPFHVTPELWARFAEVDVDLPRQDRDLPRSTMDRWVDAMHGVDDVPLRDPDRMRELRRSYYALISYVDDKVGSLLATLSACGLAEDTAVLFTSDHGDMLGERGMVQKRCFYEPSVRIPLIVAPPGGAAAAVVAEPTSILDVLPTVLQLAGVTEYLPVDGRSVLGDGPEDGPSSDLSERIVFSEYHSEGVYAPCFMVRRGSHKLIYIHGHEHQLFDLAADPDESRDLAGDVEHAAVEQELLDAVLARFDPDQLEDDIRAGLARRRVIKQAMTRTRTHWDHSPYADATQQYWRFD